MVAVETGDVKRLAENLGSYGRWRRGAATW
jgi:hypothetical protein